MFKKLLVLLSLFYAAFSFAAVEVNTASAADLDSIKGIGPSMSGKIIKERKKKGDFKDWGDLIARVKGMGEKNAAKFSASGMTVNGAAFTAAPAAAAKDPKATKSPTTPATAAPAAPAAPAAQANKAATKP